ncbi:MAG: cytochrome C oxidase subunit II [Gaiellaceae bacterium]
MAGTDKTILIAYAVAVALAALVTLAVVASTRRGAPIDTHKLAEFEKRWLGIVVLILVALLAATIWFTPYGKSTPPNAQVVAVNAEQFAWQLKPSTVRVDTPVAFVTRSQDVNHGFGIYKGHKFIAQIQVVPDRNSTLVQTFHETGTYTVLCLEFCGVGHHGMVATFTVTK